MVRIPFDHPAHSFEREDFPPTPSATGRALEHYRCRHCGLLGTRDLSGGYLYVTTRNPASGTLRACTRGVSGTVAVHTPRICDGVLFLPLVVPPPSQPLDENEGVWVDMGGVIAAVHVGEYNLVRKRTRCAERAS